jgi:hypothetical protein
MKSKVLMATLALVALMIVLPLSAGADEPKLLVTGVEVFNAPEIEAYAPGLKPMLAGRIDGEGYQVVSDEAEAEGAHWKLRTTITKLSNLYSIDAEVSPLVEDAGSARTYETIKSPDELMAALETVGTRLRQRLEMLVVALPRAGLAVPSAPAAVQLPAAAPVQPAAPVVPVAPVIPMSSAVGAQPVVAQPQPVTNPFASYKVLAKLEGEGSVLEAVDLDGDGSIELVLLLDKVVHVYRDNGESLELLWKAELDTAFRLQWISTADLDGDGSVELLAAGSDEAEVFTQAFKISGTTVAPMGEKVFAFLRGMDHPDLGRIVAGLKSIGGSEVFKPELARWSFDGGKFVKGQPLSTPDALMPINIDWVRFAPGAELSTLLVDQQNRLRIYDQQLDLQMTVEDPMKGSGVRFMGEFVSVRHEDDGSLWEVNPPTAYYRGADQKVYAVVHDNIGEASLMPKRTGSFTNGKLLSFTWDGMAMTHGGTTPEFPGFFSSLAIARAPNGKARLYALLIKEKGLIVVEQTTVVTAFDL